MKKILAIIILNLCFIIPSQADDVRDFQIEGISIGDELKNHFSNNVLSKVTKYKFKSPKYIAYEIMKSDVKSGTINFYDNIIIAVNNSNIIESIGGMIFYPNNIKDCRLEQSKVKSELQNLLKIISGVHIKNIMEIQLEKVLYMEKILPLIINIELLFNALNGKIKI